MIFTNRATAGRRLANRLAQLKDERVVVLGLVRGGLVPAAEVAHLLDAQLGAIFVRKIGHPNCPEFAIGAMAEDDDPVYDKNLVRNIDPIWLKLEEEVAREMIDRRRNMYYDHALAPPRISGRTVILVDDGIATGLTMKAAIQNVRSRGAGYVIVAAPVASRESMIELEPIVDDIVILDNPDNFAGAVGAHYRQFDQVDDMQVRRLLMGYVSKV